MRESSPNKFSPTDPRRTSQSDAKSLFRNILAVSPCGSIFCPDQRGIPTANFFRMSILDDYKEKILR